MRIRRPSGRARIALVTAMLLLGVGALIYGGLSSAESRAVDLRELVGPGAPVGERVRVSGTVVSVPSDGVVTIVPPDATDPRVRVRYTNTQGVRLAPGSGAVFVGTLVRPGFIDDALYVRIGPAKYRQSADE